MATLNLKVKDVKNVPGPSGGQILVFELVDAGGALQYSVDEETAGTAGARLLLLAFTLNLFVDVDISTTPSTYTVHR